MFEYFIFLEELGGQQKVEWNVSQVMRLYPCWGVWLPISSLIISLNSLLLCFLIWISSSFPCFLFILFSLSCEILSAFCNFKCTLYSYSTPKGVEHSASFLKCGLSIVTFFFQRVQCGMGERVTLQENPNTHFLSQVAGINNNRDKSCWLPLIWWWKPHFTSVILLPCPRLIKKNVHAQLGSHVWLFVTLWTVVRQAALSMGFFRQENWSGLSFPPPKDLPDPGTEPVSPVSPTLQLDSVPAEPSVKPKLSMKMRDCFFRSVLTGLSISGYRHKNAKCSNPPLKMTLNLKFLNSNVPGFFLISVSVVSKCINVLCVCMHVCVSGCTHNEFIFRVASIEDFCFKWKYGLNK